MRRRLSINARLTIGLGIVSALAFTVAGVLLQRALVLDLTKADRAKLLGKVAVVQHLIDEASRAPDHRIMFHSLDDLRIGHDEMHVWLFDAAGRQVYGKQPLEARGPGRGLVGTARAAVDVLEAPLSATAPWPGGRLRIALESQPRESLLRSHWLTLVGVCSLGVGASVVLSWLVVRHGLRPVTRLSAEAGEITPRSLGKRLTAPPQGVELDGLVASFNHLLARLESAYAQLEAFNANVAHELRTPLASLATGTQVALSSPRTAEQLREALLSNLEEIDLLTALVNDMLFLSRADRGDRAEGLVHVDLSDEADRTLDYCEALLHEANVEAERMGTAVALCSPPLVRRAMVNLVTNAIRHTGAEGCVRIAVSLQGEGAAVWVSNPGPPIDARTRARMFDRFYRGDASRSSRQPGRGLGLAIVAAIARMHGGSVYTERVDGENRIGFTLSNRPANRPTHDRSDCSDAAAERRVDVNGAA